MKQTIITLLLALVCLAGQAKVKDIVWEKPSTEVNTEIEGYFRTLLEITRVELARQWCYGRRCRRLAMWMTIICH